jgi:PKD repeat protein
MVYDVEELVVNVGRDLNAIIGADIWFSVSVMGGLKPYTYVWDFGDGTTSTDDNPVHQFTTISDYVVQVMITDAQGKSKSDQLIVTVGEDTTIIEPCEILGVSGGFGMKALIASGSIPVDWSISVDGLVLFGGDAAGYLGSDVIETVNLPFTVGFGNVEIEIIVNDKTERYSAFLFGPFFFNLQQI